MQLMQKNEKLHDALKRYWGYDSFHPMQEEIILSVIEGRDTLAVLPTGAGKSLCYQLPALIKDGMAVVVSPLISLMKDQVDGLRNIGVSADYLNSSLRAWEKNVVVGRILSGELRILYISPERLQFEDTIRLLKSVSVSFFVVDEAHCISHWGHDFRDDYRNLKIIKESFIGIGVHAFTATATRDVQKDIIAQLELKNPVEYIGNIDRSNLVYRVFVRTDILSQIVNVLKKHKDEPGIIYCLRRDDVDNISAKLNEMGYKNFPYHAGLSNSDRHKYQDAFAREEVDIIVATIAFGMGIDRSNVRFVIHAAMPKNIEYYHQETGRAGRDGLPAHCYLFYGGGDFRIWSHFMKDSPNFMVMMNKLKTLYNFCTRPQCRHKLLVNYFNQDYDKSSCEACDYCLGEVDMVEDALIVGQKILSCIVKMNRDWDHGFGAGHLTNILRGSATEAVLKWGHQNLSTFGIMAEETIEYIRCMIEQMLGQDLLIRNEEFKTLSVSDAGWRVLRGELVPKLAKPLVAEKKKEVVRKQKLRKEAEWLDVDRSLFNLLRKKRAELAKEKNVPAFVIFGDKSLKDMAAKMPATKDQFMNVFGVGEYKVREYGDIFIDIISKYNS